MSEIPKCKPEDNWIWDAVNQTWAMGGDENILAEKPKPTKFLCICQMGHSRSVAMVRALHHVKLTATAIGAQTADASLARVLCEWADIIILMEPHFISAVPEEFHGKVDICDVGRDRWVNPFHPELVKITTDFVAERGWRR